MLNSYLRQRSSSTSSASCTTPKRCCLASKPWISCTRKHLFADIGFQTEGHPKLWKETFLDPSTSPACYAKTLILGCSQVVVAADAEPGGWIRGFPCVVCLAAHSQATTADRSFSRPIPCNMTRHQIPLRVQCSCHSALTDHQPHSSIPSSRGPGCDHFLRDVGRRRRWLRKTIDCRPTAQHTHLYWVFRA
jgi:hypothetical protein